MGGGFANETITGFCTVNSDCTATLTANVYESGVWCAHQSLPSFWSITRGTLRAVQESLKGPDGTPIPAVITVDGNMLFPED